MLQRGRPGWRAIPEENDVRHGRPQIAKALHGARAEERHRNRRPTAAAAELALVLRANIGKKGRIEGERKWSSMHWRTSGNRLQYSSLFSALLSPLYSYMYAGGDGCHNYITAAGNFRETQEDDGFGCEKDIESGPQGCEIHREESGECCHRLQRLSYQGRLHLRGGWLVSAVGCACARR